MKIQMSRRDPVRRNFTGVYQQQGRMITDADWNEAMEIIDSRFEELTRRILGVMSSGVPIWGGLEFQKERGMFHGGVLAQGVWATAYNVQYENQRDFPGAPGQPSEGDRIYADVWMRPIVALEYPALKDPGLHGADTCARTQMMVQIKRAPASWGDDYISRTRGYMMPALALTKRASLSTSATSESFTTGNYLFRVEVHDVKGEPTVPTELTLKWSSENGAEAYASDALPVDFKGGDWLYEFYSTMSEKHLGVHLVAADGFPVRGILSERFPGQLPDASTWPFVRRWDGYCVLRRQDANSAWTLVKGWDRGVTLSTGTPQGVHGHTRFAEGDGTKNLIINLLELDFDLDMSVQEIASPEYYTTFVAGDYWQAAVREQHEPGEKLLWSSRMGIEHTYVHLGTIRDGKFVDEVQRLPSFHELMSAQGASLIGVNANGLLDGRTVQEQLAAIAQRHETVRQQLADIARNYLSSSVRKGWIRLSPGETKSETVPGLHPANAHVILRCNEGGPIMHAGALLNEIEVRTSSGDTDSQSTIVSVTNRSDTHPIEVLYDVIKLPSPS